MERRSHVFTVFLAAVTALTSISIDMSLPAVPAVERAFGLHAGHGSLTLSLFLAGYAVSPLIGGPLADRFGRRPVLLISTALFAASALLCAVAPSFLALLLARLLQGWAGGVCVTLPLAIVRDSMEGAAARQQIAAVTTVNGLTPMLAPILGSLVLLVGNWRVLFATQALFGLLVLLAIVLRFKESLPDERRQRLHPLDLVRNYAVLLRHRLFLGYALIYGLNFACIFSFISASPLLLMQGMHVSRNAYTLLFSLTVTGTIFGSLASGIANKGHATVARVLSRGLLLMGGASAIAAGLQLAGLHRPWALVPCVFAALFAFGLTAPALTLEALEPVPQLAGSGSGAIRSIQMIFGSAASAFLATAAAHPSVRAAIDPASLTTVTMCVAVFASLALYFGLLHRLPAAMPQPPREPLQ